MNTLSEKNFKSYNYLSRYATFPYYFNDVDQKYIYGLTSQLSDQSPYVLHTVENTHETFDSLALKYYNNPTLYWVICDFNGIQDPYEALKLKQQLKIPTLSSIFFKDI